MHRINVNRQTCTTFVAPKNVKKCKKVGQSSNIHPHDVVSDVKFGYWHQWKTMQAILKNSHEATFCAQKIHCTEFKFQGRTKKALDNAKPK